MSKPSVLKNTAIVGAFTMLSRLLGLVREMLQSRLIGAGVEQSAFTLAFAIPNMARKLFGEGALTAAFVPVFKGALETAGLAQAARLARAVMTMVLLLLATLVVLAMTALACVPTVPGSRTALTLQLVFILMPYMLAICGAAFGMGVLNALGRFKAASFMPALLNGVWIVTLAALALFPGLTVVTRIRIVAAAILAGGFVQMLYMFRCMARAGITPKPLFAGWGGEKVRLVWRNIGIGAMGAGAVHVNQMLDQVLAQLAAPWAAGVIGYAERLMDLPLGVIGVAFGTVLLPTFAGCFAKGDGAGARQALAASVQSMLFLMLPSAVGLAILAPDVTRVIYEGGSFDARATVRVARALAVYAVGLGFFGLQKSLTPWFQAQNDMKTPLRVSLATVILNATLNILAVLLLPVEFRHVGLAASTVLCAAAGTVLLLVFARRKNGALGLAALGLPLSKMLIAALAMGGVLFALRAPTAALAPLAHLMLLVAAGAATYGLFVVLLFGRGARRLVSRQRKCLILLLITPALGFSAFGETRSLAGTWSVREQGTAEDIPCAVPGDVLSALVAAGRQPDPYWAQNEKLAWPLAERTWEVARTFDVPSALLAKKSVALRLEDCDTFAKIYVNGQCVGETSSRFERYTFEVKPFLKAGTNEIRGVFEPAPKHAAAARQRYDRDYDMDASGPFKHQALIRKPACHAGWDWGPALMPVGFCGTVELIAENDFRIEYVHADTRWKDDLSEVTVTFRTDLTDLGSGREETVETVRTVAHPNLWWPNGMGPQTMTEFAFTVRGRTIVRRLGLRKIELVTEPSVDAKGRKERSFYFRVNNRPLFAKGANWIPADALEARQTPERYRNLLESAAAANMNMLRLWGGGQYERAAFYENCDRLGILVWHDMMFACAVYPDDADFMGHLAREFAHQIRRVKDHPSVALWCGDNECIGFLDWKSKNDDDRKVFRAAWEARTKLQAERVAKYDPARAFWPSSPCCGRGDFDSGWVAWYKGDMHFWDVYMHDEDLSLYYVVSPRFCSEFGFAGFPSREVAETFCKPEDINPTAPDFDWHLKSARRVRRLYQGLIRDFRLPMGIDETLYLSQVEQALSVETGIATWHARRPYCMGALYWQLNDIWPAGSFSSLEYGGKWKILHYRAKRLFANVTVQATPEGDLVGINDTAQSVTFPLDVEYWTFAGERKSVQTLQATLKPFAVTKLGTWQAQEGTFLVLTPKVPTALGAPIYAADRVFAHYKDCPLARAKILAQVVAAQADGTFAVEVSSDRPAFYVWLDAPGVPGVFSDNALTLLPGRPRHLTFKPSQRITRDALEGVLGVRSL